MIRFVPLLASLVVSLAAHSQVITTVAGGGTGGDGSLATATAIARPTSISLDAAGNLYVAHLSPPLVRRVDAVTTIVSTVAGTGIVGPYGGDGGLATEVALGQPAGLAVHPATGDLYISDAGHHVVRRVANATGIITTVAGNGTPAYAGDGGLATSASLLEPRGIAIDTAGNLYIADRGNSRVRVVSSVSGVITTVAGTGGLTYDGDGNPATSASLYYPHGVAVDPLGNLYIADTFNARLRRVDAATGIISTAVGTGLFEHSGDGSVATAAGLDLPQHLVLDPLGNMYIVSRNRVRRVAAGTGIITTVAGNGYPAFSGDGGPATAAGLNEPLAVALDTGGSLLVADQLNDRVRKVTLAGLSSNVATLAFAGRLPLTTSLPQRVVLTNLGSGAATVTSVTLSAPFTATHACAALAGGASCLADVAFTAPAVGAFTGTLTALSDAGTAIVDLAGAGEISLVTHYYETILRRAPDSSGKPYWDAERLRMQALGASVNEVWFAMSSYFYASAEYASFNRSDEDFAIDLYRTFFNRVPDPPGLQFWVDEMGNGMPREVVLASFQHSPEFAAFTQGLFGSTAARAEVDMVMDFYRGLLGRLPDDGGFAYWVGRFRAAQCDGSDAAGMVTWVAGIASAEFAYSGEYLAKNRTNAQYVGDLYNAFLRRGGDREGVLAWVNALDTGTFTREEVRELFRASAEFSARVTAVVDEGCLP